MAAFEVFSGVQPYQEQNSPLLPGSPNTTSNPYETTLARLRSNSSTQRSSSSPPIDQTSPISQHLIISPDPSSPPPAWKRRPSQVIQRTRTNSTGGSGGNTWTSPPVSPPSASVAQRSASQRGPPPPSLSPNGGLYSTRRHPSAALRMTSSAESGVDSSDAGTTHVVTPMTFTEREDFTPPQPMFGRTPGSSTTSLRSLSNGDPNGTRRHSAAYSIPMSEGPTELPDMSNPFRQADERPLDTVRRMTRMVERDAKRNSYLAQQHYIGAKDGAKGHVHPMAMSGHDMIWPTAPNFQPIITDAPAKRSKSTHSLASLSSRRPSLHFAKSTPTSPDVPHRQPYDIPKSPTSTLSSSRLSKASTPNGSAVNLNAAYPSARDFMLSLVPREGGYAVAAGFGGSAFPSQTQTFNGRSERSSSESKAGMNEFGRMLTPQVKAAGRMSMDAALFDYNAHGYRQPPARIGAPLQSTHSSTSDSNSTSTSYVDESLGSNSSMPSPVLQPPVTEILAPVNARPSPLSQAVHPSDSPPSDTSRALGMGPPDDDALTMRRGSGNMPIRQDSAALKSSPSQSSPLAGPPLTDKDVVAAIAATNPPASNKTKKLLEKEERARNAALVKKRVDDEKEQKRQETLRKEEAKRKEKVDKEVAKIKAKQQKKAAKQEADDRMKAIHSQRNAPKTVSASPAPINPRAPPAVGANTLTADDNHVILPDSPSAQSSGSTVRGPPAEPSQSQQPPQPTLARRVSLVAMLGRQKDLVSPTRPVASQSTSTPNPRQRATAVARGASPATSSVNSTLSKRKSSMWGALRKKLMTPKSPPPPIPQPAKTFTAPTVIQPAEYATTASPAGHSAEAEPGPPTRRSSVLDTRPMVATDAPALAAAPAKDAYAALAPRTLQDERGPPSSFSESTFNLARMTSLPSSETALSTTSHDVSREHSRDSRDRQSLGQDRSRPPPSRRSTNASVHTLQGGSPGHLSRPPSNVDKTLPSLPADGQSSS